jgi:predicted RNA-binding protein YlqC (UPF0109 family)
MEPDRKRGHFEYPILTNDAMEQQKRPRPDEFQALTLGVQSQSQQVGEVYTRLHLNQNLFAKVIGKGGAMINQIRQQYGAYLKGVDVNEAERMVCMPYVLD